MTEAEWAACRRPERMLAFARTFAIERKARLFVVACCRKLSHLFGAESLREWVEVAEQFADRLASSSDLARAHMQARRVAEWGGPLWCAGWYTDPLSGAMAHAGMKDSPAVLAVAATLVDAWAGAELCLPWATALGMDPASQAAVLRDVVHSPHRAVHVRHAWRLWNNRTVYRMAERIYEGQRWPDLPILADALLDAGCDSEEILSHCRRQERVHVRGCWVVDLLLGKV
jgi:hypothetical protein